MSGSRASVLGVVDWVLVFVTVPVALVLLVFPITWAPALTGMFRDFGNALPSLTQWVLDGVLTPLWGSVGLTLVVIACVVGRAPLGVRRGALIAALAWSCLGVGVLWLAVYLPLFGMMAEMARY